MLRKAINTAGVADRRMWAIHNLALRDYRTELRLSRWQTRASRVSGAPFFGARGLGDVWGYRRGLPPLITAAEQRLRQAHELRKAAGRQSTALALPKKVCKKKTAGIGKTAPNIKPQKNKWCLDIGCGSLSLKFRCLCCFRAMAAIP